MRDSGDEKNRESERKKEGVRKKAEERHRKNV